MTSMLQLSTSLLLAVASCDAGSDPVADSTTPPEAGPKGDDLFQGAFDSAPLLIPAEQVQFEMGEFSGSFCSQAYQNENPDDAYGTRLPNAAWLAAFAANEYAGFMHMGPFLAKLGFGNPNFRAIEIDGEGEAVSTGALIDEGDWWAAQADRGEQVLEDEGPEAFGRFKSTLMQQPREGQWIQFFTAGAPVDDGFRDQSAQAVVAFHPGSNVLIVSFRGTQPDLDHVEDLAADLDRRQTRFDADSPRLWGHVHNGFRSSLDSVWEPLLAKVLESQRGDEPAAIWVTGHSLGAALATIFTARLIEQMNQEEQLWLNLRGLYTYGSPRVGDPNFETELEFWSREENYNVQLIRVRQEQDIVTQIPLLGLRANWKHVGRQLFLEPSGELWYKPQDDGSHGIGFPARYTTSSFDVGDPNDSSGNIPLWYTAEPAGAAGEANEGDELSAEDAESWREDLEQGERSTFPLSKALADHDMAGYFEKLAAHSQRLTSLATCAG